eukprot:scaffold1289_cov178-Amphora_coffeaeformis.AAC.4
MNRTRYPSMQSGRPHHMSSVNVKSTGVVLTAEQKESSIFTRWAKALSFEKSSGDLLIVSTALPAMGNLAVAPIVAALETMHVGRIGDSLALAGHPAANSAFLTSFFLVSFFPNIAAPMIASAVAEGKSDKAKDKIGETFVQALVMGSIGTALLAIWPRIALFLVLPSNAPSLSFSSNLLRLRSLCMIPELISATSIAAFRGLLNTVTPFKILCVSRLIKILLDPLLIYTTPLKLLGAPVSTLCSEIIAAASFWHTLTRMQLISFRLLFQCPSVESIWNLAKNGTAMMIRQLAIYVAFISSTRIAQSLDATGVTGAAYGIVNQMYTIGFVVHVAMQGAAAALVPSILSKSGRLKGQGMADRIFAWGCLTGCVLGLLQLGSIPLTIPLFTNLVEVQEAARVPAVLSCFLHVINGPRFAAEGIMMGLQSFRDLTFITLGSVGVLVALLHLTSLGKSLPGVMFANMIFCSLQAIGLLLHYLFVGRLAGCGKEEERERKIA